MPPSGQYIGIGNPFASAIDMKSVLNPTSGVTDFYVFDPNSIGGLGLGIFQLLTWDGAKFIPIPGGGSYSSTTFADYIESGLGFFVQGNGVTGSITITEAAKSLQAPALSFTSGTTESIKATLLLAPNIGLAPQILDGFKMIYSSQFADTINGFDILKTANTGENAGIVSAGKSLILERRQKVVNNDTIHIKTTNLRVQNYQWELVLDNMDYPGRTGFLIDRYLNTTTPLNMAGTTTVNFPVANIAGSYAADRFKIVFQQPDLGPVPVTITSVAANRKEDRSIEVSWKVENELNISSYDVQRSADGSNFGGINSRPALVNNGGRATYNHNDGAPLMADNFYRIKATSMSGQVQYSAIVKVTALKQAGSISVYPNPVVDGNVQVRFISQPLGKYQLQLSNAAGQVLYKAAVSVNSAAQSQTIALPANTTSGSYQLKVIAADGTTTVQQVMLK